jgi:hypothetical protein
MVLYVIDPVRFVGANLGALLLDTALANPSSSDTATLGLLDIGPKSLCPSFARSILDTQGRGGKVSSRARWSPATLGVLVQPLGQDNGGDGQPRENEMAEIVECRSQFSQRSYPSSKLPAPMSPGPNVKGKS